VLIGLGTLGIVTRGFPGRYTAAQLAVASFNDDGHLWRTDQCFLIPGASSLESFLGECLAINPDKRNYLLMGDSHAAQLWHALTVEYPEINFLQATATDCFPTLEHGLTESSFCGRLMNQTLTGLAVDGSVNRVILAARWKPELASNLYATLDFFRQHGIAVTVIGPSIVFDGSFPRLLIRGDRSRDPSFLDKHWNHSLLEFDKDLRVAVSAHGAEYISLIGLATNNGAIQATDQNGMPLITDQEHFSTAGSILIAEKMRELGIWTESPEPHSLQGRFIAAPNVQLVGAK